MTDETLDLMTRDLLEPRPFAAYPTDPPRDLAQAYDLQRALSRRLIAGGAHGHVAGWKIAANNPALLERFGLREPISAPVFSGQIRRSPARLDRGDYLQFAFEPEIAAIIGRDIAVTDGPPDRETVADAIDRFVPAFELLDMRGIDMPSVHIADAVAQNISNVGLIFGGPGIAPRDLDISTLRTRVTVDGRAELDTTGAAPEHPLDAVAWLAGHLGRRSETLRPGDVVLCGTHCPIWYLDGAVRVEVEMSGLGTAAFDISG